MGPFDTKDDHQGIQADKPVEPRERPGRFRLHCELSQLETLSTCSLFRRGELELKAMAHSGDGKLRAVAEANRDTPHLFDADTGRRILPRAGHTDHIVGLYFAADGKTLRSLDRDNHICMWDARYLFCHDEAETGRWTLLTVDADTGETVASVVLPSG